MNIQHAQQVKDWNGDSGERWVIHQSWLDRMLQAFGDAAIKAAKVRPGETILDVGCGAGTSSFALAERAGVQGHVTGIDISAPLIKRARERMGADRGTDFLLADAAKAELPLAHFNLLYSRFGVMFFDDPVSAFRHLRSALKPSGRIGLVCWRKAEENDWARLPMRAIEDIVPPAPPLPPNAPGPFSFGDPRRVETILTKAGFQDITIASYDHDIVFGRGETREAAVEDALHMAFEIGPLSRALANADDALLARASDAVRAAFERRANDRAVTIKGAAWIITARNYVDPA